MIPKYQKAPGPIKFIDWNKEIPIGQELTDKAIESTRKITKPIEESTKKAVKRDNKTSALQLKLWNSGAFKGVIDKRTGK